MDIWRSGDFARPVWLLQLGKFMAVGGVNTLVDLGGFYLLTQATGLVDHPVLAKLISYSFGILNSFVWNRLWTFRSGIAFTPGLALFVLSNLGSLFLNAGVMYFGLSAMKLSREFALALATASAFLLNFVVSKFVVFRS